MGTPAARFLKACIAASNGRELDPGVLPQSPGAWDRALRLAASNALEPLVCGRLQRMRASSTVPKHVWHRLRLLYHASGLQAVRLQAGSACILRALRRADVPVIVLKGMALAGAVWRDLALRPMADIDIMVPEEDLPVAQEVLEGLGYFPSEFYRPASWYRRQHHHLVPRQNPATGITVEIHRNIVASNPSFALSVRGFWERARPQSVAGVEALVLSPEDTVIHLCLHTACDAPFVGKIRSVADLVQTIAAPGRPLLWYEVAERSVRYRVARFVHYVLDHVATEYGVAIPRGTREALRSAAAIDPVSDRLLRWLIPFCVFQDEGRRRLVADWRLRHAAEALLFGRGAAGRMAAMLGGLDEQGRLRSVTWPAALGGMALRLVRTGGRAICPRRGPDRGRRTVS